MRIIISAGGTGGHIYPALAIIEKIKEREPESAILYIGTHNRMEKDIIPKHNIKYIPLEIYGFSKRNIWRNIKNVFLIIKATKKCQETIKVFKPDIVIGVGGYVTYPVLKAAHKLNIKTFIHEQNAIPGKSNKAISKFVDVVGVSFKESKSSFKNVTYVTGNPCSERVLKLEPATKKSLGLTKDKKLITIVAGSLGSYSLNKIFKEFLKSVVKEKYEIVYITGKDYYDDFMSNNKFSSNVKILPYYEDLGKLLKITDLVISRSGATTISELIALSLPSILIPSPYVPNNHQYFNAKRLSDKGASVLLPEKDLNVSTLKQEIDKLLNNKDVYYQMKEELSKINIPNSSEYIYNIIKDMVVCKKN